MSIELKFICDCCGKEVEVNQRPHETKKTLEELAREHAWMSPVTYTRHICSECLDTVLTK